MTAALSLAPAAAQAQAPAKGAPAKGAAAKGAPAKGAPAKGAAAPDDAAAKLVADGLKALKADKAEEARVLLLEAYGLKPGFRLAGELGRAEVGAGKYREGAEHLSLALRDKPDNLPEAEAKAWEEAFTKATAQLGVLKISVRPNGADVVVGGRSVGTSPLPGPVFVEPGQVLVEARKEGYFGLRSTKTLAAGAEEAMDFTLHRDGGVAPGGPPPASASTIFRGITLPIVISGAAVSAAGTVIGASLAILSAVKASKSHGLEEPDATCGATCKDQFDALQKQKVTFAGASMWSFIGAGTVLLGTGTYLAVTVFTRPKQPVSARLVVRPDQIGAALTLPW